MNDGTYTRLVREVESAATIAIPERLFNDYPGMPRPAPAAHARDDGEAAMLDGLHRIFSTFFDPDLIAQALPEVLAVGLPNTLLLSVFASVIGIVLGLLVAAGLLSGRRGVRLPCRGYVDILRGLPHILTVYLIGQGLPLAGLADLRRQHLRLRGARDRPDRERLFRRDLPRRLPERRARPGRGGPQHRHDANCRRCATSSFRRARAACCRR